MSGFRGRRVMRSALWPALVWILSLALAGSAFARMKTKVVVGKDADLSAIETYGWRTAHEADSGHALAEGSPLDKELRSLIDAELSRRGLVKRTEGTPDAWIVILGYSVDRLFIDQPVRYDLTAHLAWAEQGSVQSELQGTLILEIFEASNDQLVWSAAARDVAGSREKLQKKGSKAVKQIFKLFPR